LLSFKEDLLPEKEKRAVQTHLDRCEGCRRELDQIERITEVVEQNPGEKLVQTPKPLLESALAMIPIPGQRENPAPKPSGAMEGLRKIVARWVTPESTQFALPRSLIGANQTKHSLYEAEGVEIALGIKRRNNGRWGILGELFPETPSGDAMLFLRDGNGSRKTSLEASQFGFYDVEEGEYVLQILYGNQLIEIGDVVVT
jgi:hypothetical protein